MLSQSLSVVERQWFMGAAAPTVSHISGEYERMAVTHDTLLLERLEHVACYNNFGGLKAQHISQADRQAV
jgi:hypothetical protein